MEKKELQDQKNEYRVDLAEYASLARRAAAEGCVLLENQDRTLPIQKGTKVAVFGRMAFHYYKSGLGSGGLVNTAYEVGILDALRELEAEQQLFLDHGLLEMYEAWIKEHPFDEGEGWGRVPWHQEEMPVTDAMLAAARENDLSLLIIGRTAGEDQDNRAEQGSYYLTDVEEELIRRVCTESKKTVVVLNTGNIMDMNWTDRYHPDAVLYAWQGGQEGGHGVADVLTGRVCAGGHLTDTIAKDIADYPSTKNFGDLTRNFYEEDIYVGYRYFETFAKDRVRYPFGYGLSYTEFAIAAQLEGSTNEENCVGDASVNTASSESIAAGTDNFDVGEIASSGNNAKNTNTVIIRANIKNTGDVTGAEVVQVYAKVPCGKLGNPARRLVAFARTEDLAPGETQTLLLPVSAKDLASYDDSGVTGHKDCFVLEAGAYEFYVGNNVRDAVLVGSRQQEFAVVETLEEVCAPVLPFARKKAVCSEDGVYTETTEDVPLRTVDPQARRKERQPKPLAITGPKGISLMDVADGKATMDAFAAQIDEENLELMFYGEGMCSPKVTAGTPSAFGGLNKHLQELGIPAGCCADGPSGIRMDCGTKAFAMPIGTALACSFDEELVEALFVCAGRELRHNRIDALLGPGMNIRRNPLNGRNFEYFSEDPYITGKLAAAELRGLERYHIAGTMKHFCGNNQEAGRSSVDSVISQRALREIYLRGFEIAVKEATARAIMTTYGSLNGIWTAGNYDLCTTILREEWGFDGIVMTDWWGTANYEGELPDSKVKAPMIAAGNDLFMVAHSAQESLAQEDIPQKMEEGWIAVGELQRNAIHILRFLMTGPALLRMNGRISPEEEEALAERSDEENAGEFVPLTEEADGTIVIDGAQLHPGRGKTDYFSFINEHSRIYNLEIEAGSELEPLAQLSVSIFMDNVHRMTISMNGTRGAYETTTHPLEIGMRQNHYMKLFYGADHLDIRRIRLIPRTDSMRARAL